jgi:hypothetical protein
MERYRLFAARDGDVIEELIQARDEDEARVIAAHRIVEEFDLEIESHDFDEVVAETDGAMLALAFETSTANLVRQWACSQLQFLSHVEERIEASLKPAMRGCTSGLLTLILAAQESQSVK